MKDNTILIFAILIGFFFSCRADKEPIGQVKKNEYLQQEEKVSEMQKNEIKAFAEKFWVTLLENPDYDKLKPFLSKDAFMGGGESIHIYLVESYKLQDPVIEKDEALGIKAKLHIQMKAIEFVEKQGRIVKKSVDNNNSLIVLKKDEGEWKVFTYYPTWCYSKSGFDNYLRKNSDVRAKLGNLIDGL